MTEDREQNPSEDREQNADDVEGHNLTGGLVGQAAGQQVSAADDDDPDVEGHALVGQNAGGEPSGSLIGSNTGEPTDSNIA